METAEAIFVVCSNCGEWSWNGMYRVDGVLILDPFFEKSSAVCFCCIRDKMNKENTWFNAAWWEDANNFKVDMSLICRN